jgi:hypothetical protein
VRHSKLSKLPLHELSLTFRKPYSGIHLNITLKSHENLLKGSFSPFSFSSSINPPFHHSTHYFLHPPPLHSLLHLTFITLSPLFSTLFFTTPSPLFRYPQLTEFWLSAFGKKQIVTVEVFCTALSTHLCDGMYVLTSYTCISVRICVCICANMYSHACIRIRTCIFSNTI